MVLFRKVCSYFKRVVHIIAILLDLFFPLKLRKIMWQTRSITQTYHKCIYIRKKLGRVKPHFWGKLMFVHVFRTMQSISINLIPACKKLFENYEWHVGNTQSSIHTVTSDEHVQIVCFSPLYKECWWPFFVVATDDNYVFICYYPLL